MTTRHLAALTALEALVAGAVAARVEIADELPEDCPPEGLVALVGEPWVEVGRRASPPRREFERDITLQIVVSAASTALRDAALDAIFTQIGAALEADKNLGGVVDTTDMQPPEFFDEVPMAGAASLKGASLPIRLYYETAENQMESIS